MECDYCESSYCGGEGGTCSQAPSLALSGGRSGKGGPCRSGKGGRPGKGGCSGEPPPPPPLQTFTYDCAHETAWLPAKELTVQDKGNGAYLIIDKDSTAEAVQAGKALFTTGGFIVTAEGVVVVETYINNYIACQARKLIVETTAKPIKYVVVTSSHGDHSFGSPVFNAEGVTYVSTRTGN